MPKSQSALKNVSTAMVLAGFILCVAIASWFYVNKIKGMVREDKAYKNVTFTDALLTCQNYSRERYGAKLKQLTMHKHSSRWDQSAGQYKIFFRADILGKNPALPAAEFWLACDVSGSSGQVRDYDAQENKGLKSEAQRMNDSGMFGWP
jgi:hypothetical protein